MAESFTNALARGVGIVTSSATASIGVNSTSITGVGTTGVHVGDLIDTQNFLKGTTVTSIGVGTVFVDRNSLNSAAATNQSVKILGITTIFASPASTKSILTGGTLSNNTNNQVKVTVQIASGSTSFNLMSDIPIPAGSSFVISDAGKTTLLGGEEIRVLCDTDQGVDASVSILSGIS